MFPSNLIDLEPDHSIWALLRYIFYPPSTTDRARYEEKLKVCVGEVLIVLPDPYSIPTSRWICNPRQLPPLQYPTIYNYLILTPGPFMGEALQAYKSLDANSYFISGHVHEVLQHEIPTVSAVLFIKGLVVPGQRVTDKPYEPWLRRDKTRGYVIAAHCNCMAGLGECRSHVAAILFAIEAVTCRGVNSDEACTSMKCIRSKYYKKDVVPSRAEDLDLGHPHHGFTSRKKTSSKRKGPQINSRGSRAATRLSEGCVSRGRSML